MEEKKKKILTISDMPFYISGVAHTAREFIDALWETGRYKFVCVGGGKKPDNPTPFYANTEKYGEDVLVYPVEGYGDVRVIRGLMASEKPDMLWYQTDPRFFNWLHQISDEILINMPIVWYTIWDNYPVPKFNKKLYKCNTHLSCISKLTYNIVEELTPEVSHNYLPHFVNDTIFRKYKKEDVLKEKIKILGKRNKDKFVFFYNSRNAQRKMTGSMILWFKKFLDVVGEDKAILLMHTQPRDPAGQNLYAVIGDMGLTGEQVKLSMNPLSPDAMAMLYNVVDCTILLSNAEGWGLAITESMSCETPVIATLTGGMQDQIVSNDGKTEFGVAIKPVSKSLIGSQDVPYIFDDRVCEEDAVNAMLKMYNMSQEEREELGKKAKQHIVENYDYNTMKKKWVDTIDQIIEENGSWEDRRNYKSWEKFEY